MALRHDTMGGASAPSDLSCANMALGYALRLITADLGPKKRAKLVGQAYRRAVAAEQAAKVRMLRVQGEPQVRPLLPMPAEEVRQRQAQLDALALLIPALLAELEGEA